MNNYMDILLSIFFVIAIVALLDQNKRVHELEEKQKERKEIDKAVLKLIEDLNRSYERQVEDKEANEPVL